MKKSKHFRKDVIMARIIAAILLIVLIALIILAVLFFTKPSDKNDDSQNSQDTQNSYIQSEELSDSEEETEEMPDSETETEADVNEEIYVKTTTQVKLRQEPNTNCATLDRIDGGTKLKVIESLQGWYKVNHNGQVGYVSETYAEIVEE